MTVEKTAASRVLVTGVNGQLGRALMASVPAGFRAIATTRDELDITDSEAVTRYVAREKPAGIINAAAYTAVDKAEENPLEAAAVNHHAAGYLAEASAQHSIPLVHVSTDFVFDGSSGEPCGSNDECKPLSVYGHTKRDGELAVLATNPERTAIIRTAWVYGAGGQNFVSTMLRLMTERDRLGVVADQIGSPTRVSGLAVACWRALQLNLQGIYHWTDAGVASWYDFAVAIQDEALQKGLLSHRIPVTPLATADYPTPAVRPPHSVLDKTHTWAALGIEPVHWRHQLKLEMAAMVVATKAREITAS